MSYRLASNQIKRALAALVANDEAQVRAFDFRTIREQRAEESGVVVNVAIPIRDVAPDELAGPRMLRVVGHSAANADGFRNEDFHHIGVVNDGVSVFRIFICGTNFPAMTFFVSQDARSSVSPVERESANPGVVDPVIPRRELHSKEPESAIHAVESGGFEHGRAALRTFVGVAEVIASVAVLALEIVEGETIADCGVDRSHLVDSSKRI